MLFRSIWVCGSFQWYAGGRHTNSGIDHTYDLVDFVCILAPTSVEEHREQLQRELRETHQELGMTQRLLDEEREKSARQTGQLHEFTVGWASGEAALLKVIRILARRQK